MERELKLVKLHRIPDHPFDYFAIGYYTDHGFVFALLTPDVIKTLPLRNLPFPQWSEYASSNHIEILGIINDLPLDKTSK